MPVLSVGAGMAFDGGGGGPPPTVIGAVRPVPATVCVPASAVAWLK